MQAVIEDQNTKSYAERRQNRLENKRTITRQSLITAAKQLVKERGYEKISIQDITDRADVGLGTFYNYFETKQSVFEAILQDIQSEFDLQLLRLRAPLKDPATIMAVTLQFSFEQAQDNDDWKTFVSYAGLEQNHLLHQDLSQCVSDVERGMKGGRFKVEDESFTAGLIFGMVQHVSLEISHGRLLRGTTVETSRYILRMLGLPDVVAMAVAQSAQNIVTSVVTAKPPIQAPRRAIPKQASSLDSKQQLNT